MFQLIQRSYMVAVYKTIGFNAYYSSVIDAPKGERVSPKHASLSVL